jgi:hypothetical protein
MGFASTEQVVDAVEQLAFKGDGSLIRTQGLWHVLMFLRYRACSGLRDTYTFNAHDLAQASFDICGIKLPDAVGARRTYFEPGATGGRTVGDLFRNQDGPRQTFLNRIYTGLEGSGPRKPNLFKVSANVLPTKLTLQTDWIETLRHYHDNTYVLDEQTANLVTWLFRFGVPAKGKRTAYLTKAGANGTLAKAEGVTQQAIPSTSSELRTALQEFLGLEDAQLKQLIPKLDEAALPLYESEEPIPDLNLSSALEQKFLIRSKSSDDGPARSMKIGTNTIFFGPPGTGKSTQVKRSVGSGKVFRTQFHPEYTHGDFLGTYRPVVGFETFSEDKITAHDGRSISKPTNYFAFVPGPLTLALESSFDAQDEVFLVIEEINRGDCAAIFGEAFQLLDRNEDGQSEFGIHAKPELIAYFESRGVDYDIEGDGMLYLPPNLTLIATMNTSDQSLQPMDSAFKRRWQWVACHVDYAELLSYTLGTRPFLDDGFDRWDWIHFLEQLNADIVSDRMEDRQVGPWFIKPERSGSVPFGVFLNKCLFYLWHDVFKDEQLSSDFSPFKKEGPATFGDLQKVIREKGLAAAIKADLLKPLEEPGHTAPATGEPASQGAPEPRDHEPAPEA